MKHTKKALLLSVMSLLLCVSMLVGTTFAWFTDSVTSGNNQIIAGNLDIELEYANTPDGTYKSVVGEGDIFVAPAGATKGLWEPGHTEVAYLKITNAGTLYLKYRLQVAPYIETVGKNADGGDIQLSKILKFAATEPSTAAPAAYTRETAQAAAVNAAEQVALTEYTTKTVTMAPDETQYIALVVYMPEEVDNKANYRGDAIPTIEFALSLFATQFDAENDSFGNDYDAGTSCDYTPVSGIDELKIALANKVENIILTGNCYTDDSLNIDYAANIDGGGFTLARAEGYTGTVFTVKPNAALTLANITVDGGAVWSGETDSTLQRGTNNTGVTATGNLIAAENNGSITLNDGAILQNNVGAYAVNLGTRIGATLTVNGGQIINNQSEAGAIWGGGNITVNSGKINGNSSTGFAGVIRMVSSCNLTVNGGEINHNKAAGDGGVIWGSGISIYTFTGGEMAYNESASTGGAIYTGNSSVINISGDFEMHDNKAANSGAIRLTNGTSLTMTGGKIYNNTQDGVSNAFNTWNNPMSITGGSISDDFSYVGGVGLKIGDAEIDGVISYSLSTNHNTAYLAAEFNAFAFTVNEEASNFGNFNFKPDADYAYTEGDEAKLVCLNEGYSTYWDAATGTFRLKAD